MKISYDGLKSELLMADILLNPEKYTELIDTEKIVADKKVTREGVERYKKVIDSNGYIKPLVVIKHPKIELYAVFDGHHRYWAHKEKEIKQIRCAPIRDSLGLLLSLKEGLLFYMTQKGYFQPSSEFTKQVRIPVLSSMDKLKIYLDYLQKFLDYPEKLRESIKRNFFNNG